MQTKQRRPVGPARYSIEISLGGFPSKPKEMPDLWFRYVPKGWLFTRDGDQFSYTDSVWKPSQTIDAPAVGRHLFGDHVCLCFLPEIPFFEMAVDPLSDIFTAGSEVQRFTEAMLGNTGFTAAKRNLEYARECVGESPVTASWVAVRKGLSSEPLWVTEWFDEDGTHRSPGFTDVDEDEEIERHVFEIGLPDFDLAKLERRWRILQGELLRNVPEDRLTIMQDMGRTLTED